MSGTCLFQGGGKVKLFNMFLIWKLVIDCNAQCGFQVSTQSQAAKQCSYNAEIQMNVTSSNRASIPAPGLYTQVPLQKNDYTSILEIPHNSYQHVCADKLSELSITKYQLYHHHCVRCIVHQLNNPSVYGGTVQNSFQRHFIIYKVLFP